MQNYNIIQNCGITSQISVTFSQFALVMTETMVAVVFFIGCDII